MDDNIVAGMKRGLHRMNESSIFSEALREPVLLAILYITELEQEVERLTAEREEWRETYGKLRWGVVADGAIIIACVRRQRAEQLAALGAQHTPGIKECVAKRMPLHLAPEPATPVAARGHNQSTEESK